MLTGLLVCESTCVWFMYLTKICFWQWQHGGVHQSVARSVDYILYLPDWSHSLSRASADDDFHYHFVCWLFSFCCVKGLNVQSSQCYVLSDQESNPRKCLVFQPILITTDDFDSAMLQKYMPYTLRWCHCTFNHMSFHPRQLTRARTLWWGDSSEKTDREDTWIMHRPRHRYIVWTIL